MTIIISKFANIIFMEWNIYFFFHRAMATTESKEQFLKKFEEIVESVIAMKSKVQKKHDEEKVRRDDLNSELLALMDLQRKYAAALKQFKLACEGN